MTGKDETDTIATLASEYGDIANLTKLLDVEITQFVDSLNEMVEAIPHHDTLSEIYKERTIDINTSSTETTQAGQTQGSTLDRNSLLGDEAPSYSNDAVKRLRP
jgi:hypothetical protein